MPHFTDALTALDRMLKTADVEFVTWEKKLGGRLVTIIVRGSVSAVNAAVEAVVGGQSGKVVAHLVLPNPHPETVKMVELSRTHQGFSGVAEAETEAVTAVDAGVEDNGEI